MTKQTLKYSGAKSTKFWKLVNSITGKEGRKIYAMSVKLQNIEEKVLKRINEITQTI